MSKKILLTQSKFAIVDDEDFGWLNRHKWYALKRRNDWVAARGVRKKGRLKKIYMHRLVNKTPRTMETDHKDHNGLNNRRDNLRPATKSQNQQNRRRQKGTSEFKGVCWRRPVVKWLAQIKARGRKIHLGLFISEIEAAKAYDVAARKYFGEFAYTNF